jgi:hypothetical protein
MGRWWKVRHKRINYTLFNFTVLVVKALDMEVLA